MKKLSLIFTVTLSLFLCGNAKAQTAPPPPPPVPPAPTVTVTTTDYYPGKWNVIIKGTPNGDAKLTFVLERKDGKLAGAVQDSTGKELTKITQIDEKDKTLTAAFTIQSYDVTLTLDPIDDDHVKGSLMGMFDATGVRVKETK